MKRISMLLVLLFLSVSVTALVQTVTASIATGNIPHAVAVNPNTNKIYVGTPYTPASPGGSNARGKCSEVCTEACAIRTLRQWNGT